MRIPNRFLPHRVDIEPPDPFNGEGHYLPKREARPCSVASKSQLVVDTRPGMADAETGSQQVLANTQIILQPEDIVAPGARVTVWKGTPQEAELSVVATEYYRHNIAPESAVLWLV